jgi:hypothetical protein
MVNSIIIEELSENYTDSEFSNKKKSFIFSKSRHGSSGKLMRVSNRISREYNECKQNNFLEKNLNKEIFIKMDSKNKNINRKILNDKYIDGIYINN